MSTALTQRLAAALPDNLPHRLGVAVSGGGDSMALLTMLHTLCKGQGTPLCAVTVDHRLRPESALEAASVASYCETLNVPHQILAWKDWDGAGNVQKAARDARYALIASWAQEHNIQAIALGHTVEDQAETVLMRLARGSGVDGLSAMAPVRFHGGTLWLRPMLTLHRAALRGFLRENNILWHDDPSNEDLRFERIKARQALGQLEPLGLDAQVLAHVAGHMQSVQEALVHETRRVAKSIVKPRAGGLEIPFAAFTELPDEIARRLIRDALAWITGAEYGPRGKSLSTVLKRLPKERSATLEGCRLILQDAQLWLFRELNAVQSKTAPVGTLWDGRWRVDGPQTSAQFHVAALGSEGLSRCPDWRDTGLPRDLLMVSPAVWEGATFRAAPLAGLPDGWCATLETNGMHLFDA